MDTTFSIADIFHRAWTTLVEHKKLIIQATLTIALFQILSGILDIQEPATSADYIQDVVGGVLGAVGSILGIGFMVIALKLSRGQNALYKELIPRWAIFWRVFIAGIVTGLLTAIGLILLIIPGIYLMLRFSMVNLSIIDGNGETGPLDALKKSSALTVGVKWKLLGLIALLILINLAGLLALVVGLLVTVPLTVLIMSHVYLELLKRLEPVQMGAVSSETPPATA